MNMVNIVSIITNIIDSKDFIGMKDHNNTLSNGIHTLELRMN